MILEATINKLLRDVSKLILVTPAGDAAIAAKQNAPRPSGAYVDVDFISDIPLGWEQSTLENNVGDDDLTQTIEGSRNITMSLGFYRTNAINNARKVRTGLVRESIQELFKAANIGLVSRSVVREISEPLKRGWEQRAQFDVTLNAIGTDTDIIRSILSLDIAGEFQARGLKYNFNIEVS